MGKIKMSKTVPAETNHLRGDRESPGDGKNKIRVKTLPKMEFKTSDNSYKPIKSHWLGNAARSV